MHERYQELKKYITALSEDRIIEVADVSEPDDAIDGLLKIVLQNEDLLPDFLNFLQVPKEDQESIDIKTIKNLAIMVSGLGIGLYEVLSALESPLLHKGNDGGYWTLSNVPVGKNLRKATQARLLEDNVSV